MWLKVCKSDELRIGHTRTITHGQVEIALFHTGEGVFAIDNSCPHAGASLHHGEVGKGVVYCHWHDWPFRLRDGLCLIHKGSSVTAYPVKQEQGYWWLDPDAGVNQAERPQSV